METLQIGPIRYSVVRTTFQNQNLMGRILYESATIEISESLPGPVAIHTAMHEVVHSLLYHTGELEHNERMVESLAHALMQFIQDNPAFVRKIQRMKPKK